MSTAFTTADRTRRQRPKRAPSGTAASRCQTRAQVRHRAVIGTCLYLQIVRFPGHILVSDTPVVAGDGTADGTMTGMTADALQRLAEELGIDVVGAGPAEAYDSTEQYIIERRARGLFADMRFTMAQPEISCHPELLLEHAQTVVSAALCYYAPGPDPQPGEGRLPRYTWWDAYGELREKLTALGERIGGEYRVLVDENQH